MDQGREHSESSRDNHSVSHAFHRRTRRTRRFYVKRTNAGHWPPPGKTLDTCRWSTRDPAVMMPGVVSSPTGPASDALFAPGHNSIIYNFSPGQSCALYLPGPMRCLERHLERGVFSCLNRKSFFSARLVSRPRLMYFHRGG